jgi:DNA-binding transcriptional MerR regulator
MVIPDKRYFTIGEVSTLCALKPHVLRYWEQEFDVLRPNKRRGNRRYYRREDVLMIEQIKHLLYEKGFTISGARAQLMEAAPIVSPSPVGTSHQAIRALLHEAINILS